ncbi:MAG: hypothetical protein QM763_12995 [Agriterribacter sp.]
MKKILTTILMATIVTAAFSQKKFGNWYERKTFFGLEIDAAPLCSMNGEINRMGIGGGLVFEYAPITSFSIALNGGVVPYFSLGEDDGKEGAITIAPLTLTLRKFFPGGFFIGPKGGVSWNIDADTYTLNTSTNTYEKTKAQNFLYGFGIGFRPTRQKMNVEMAYVAHKLPYGTMHTFQGSYRYYFIRNLKKSQ